LKDFIFMSEARYMIYGVPYTIPMLGDCNAIAAGESLEDVVDVVREGILKRQGAVIINIFLESIKDTGYMSDKKGVIWISAERD